MHERGHRTSLAGLPAVGMEPTQLPPGRLSLSPGPGPLQPTWRGCHCWAPRRNAALGEQPGTWERIRVHLILFSVFAASSLLDVRVRQVCERKAGDVGGRDGESGIRRCVRPALLRTPGRRRRREVLGCLKRRLGTKKVTCCLRHKRVGGEVIIPLKASTFFIS